MSFLFILISFLLTAQPSSHSAEYFMTKGISAANLGKLDSANYYLEKAGLLYQNLQQWNEALKMKIYRAENYIVLGQYATAIALAREVSQESEKRFGPRHYLEGLASETTGNAMVKTGNYEGAIEQFWDAELIFYTQETNRSHLASLYNATGNAYREKGAYSQALDYFNRAKAMFQRQGDNVNEAVAQFNTASCYVMQEKFEQAIADYEGAADVLKAKLGSQHPAFGTVYNNIGTAYFYQGHHYPLALDYFQKATKLKQAQFGEQHLEVARGYFNQGWAHEEMRNWRDSEAAYRKAEDILASLFHAGHPLLTWTYNRHGHLFTKLKKFPEAIELYEKAGSANQHTLRGEKVYFDKTRAIETLTFSAATCYEWYKASRDIGLLRKSLQFLIEAEALMNKTRSQTLKESDRLDFGRLSRGLYEQGVEVCYALFRQTKEASLLNQFFHFSDKGKSVVLNQALEESKALKFAGVPDSLLQEEKENRRNYAQFSQMLSGFDPATQPPSELKEIEEGLFLLTGSNKLLLQRLEESYPRYYELKYQSTSVELKALQQQLSPRQLLVSYFITDSITYVSYTTTAQFEVIPVAVRSTELERLILQLRNSILFQQKDPYIASASQLYRHLFPKPVDAPVQELIIIPDSRLAKVPFEALLEKIPTKGAAFAAMDFLVKRFTVAYAYSAQLFFRQARETDAVVHKSLLAIAPVFAEGQGQKVNLRTRNWLSKTQGMLDSSKQTRGQLFKGEQITPLPATGDEIRALYSLFDKHHFPAEIFIGAGASEHILKSNKLNEYGFVHIATHGFVNEEAPELSGILLSQDTADYQEDNILYMGEIYNLELKSELVTLSACETGLGKVIEGEGVVGLTRALMFAGAKNIVVSLWKVNDASTASLMIEFYQRLLQQSGITVSGALQKAKITLISGGPFSDPYYWSPFILLGR